MLQIENQRLRIILISPKTIESLKTYSMKVEFCVIQSG